MKNIIQSLKSPAVLFGIGLLVWACYSIAQTATRLQYILQKFQGYTTLADLATSLIILLLITLIIILTGSKREKAANILPFFMLGSLSILFIGTALILANNPEGRFPWGNPKYYLYTSARVMKTRSFVEQNKQAEILVLGSSRAFTLSTETLTKQYKLSAYNMSVESGGLQDYLWLTNFVLANQKEAPRLLLVEINIPTLLNTSWMDSPIHMTPYMPQEKRPIVYWNTLKSVFTYSGLSASGFLQFIQLTQAPYLVFEKDGYIVEEAPTPQEYQLAVTKDLDIFFRLRCTNISNENKNEMKQFIEVAKENKSAIVFYRSPLNYDFKRRINQEDAQLKTCEKLVKSYLTQLDKNYPHVFFQDLYGSSIENLKNKGYTDAWHLTTYGAEKVLSALEPKIQEALQWAQKNRK